MLGCTWGWYYYCHILSDGERCWYRHFQSQRNPRACRWNFGYLDLWLWQPNIQKTKYPAYRSGLQMDFGRRIPSTFPCLHIRHASTFPEGSVGQLHLRRWPRYDADGHVDLHLSHTPQCSQWIQLRWLVPYAILLCYGRCRYGQRLAEILSRDCGSHPQRTAWSFRAADERI